MREWCTQHADWRGTAAELAEQVRHLRHDLNLGDDGVMPNERLVRNYVQLGILDKPVRSGKGACFGVRQVIEYLAARQLIGEGWPLAKIAEFNRTQGLEGLLALLPAPRPRTPAEQVVARLRAATETPPPMPKPADLAAAPEPLSPVMSHSAAWTQRQTRMRDQLRALGHPTGEPERTPWMKLTLTPWCELSIDPEGLRAVAPEQLEDLGETIAHLLRKTLQNQKRRPS